MVLSDPRVDQIRQCTLQNIESAERRGYCDKLCVLEKCTWITTCANAPETSNRSQHAEGRRLKGGLESPRVCLKCGSEVGVTFAARQKHCLRHVKNEHGIRDIFICLLCPEKKRYTSLNRVNMNAHIKKKHCLKETCNYKKYYTDNYTGKYHPIIKRMLRQCFGKILQPEPKSGVQCLKCGEKVHVRRTRENHCFHHIMEEYNICDMYKCLVCVEKEFTTNYFATMKGHMLKYHKIKNWKDSLFYVDNRQKYIDVIKKMYFQCFRYKFESFFNRHRNRLCSEKMKKSKTYIKCAKCESILENNFNSQKRDHCYVHLKAINTFSYLYECLLCESTCFKTTRLPLMRIHLRKHEIKHAQVNVHYMDRTKLYELQTQIMMDECFGHNRTFKRTDEEIKKESQKLKCIKCSEFVTNTSNDKAEHCMKHFSNMKKEDINETHIKMCFEELNLLYNRMEMDNLSKQNSKYFTKCVKCGTMVRKAIPSMNLHVVIHLKEEYKFDYLFKCLLCKSKSKITYLCLKDMRQHIIKGHQMKQGRIGVHYACLINTSASRRLINEKRTCCFKETL